MTLAARRVRAPRPAVLAVALLGVGGHGALAASAPAAEPAPPAVESITPGGYRVRVPVGDPSVARGRVLGLDLAEIDVPGGTSGGAPGGPQLPVRTILLRVPWGVAPVARVTAAGVRPLGTLDPVPFARLLTEPDVLARVGARAVAAAVQGGPYRAPDAATLGPLARATPMAAGAVRYLAVTIRPVTWDPVTREARAATEVVIDVSWSGAAAGSTSPTGASPAAGLRAARGAALAPEGAVGPTYAPRIAGGSGAPRASARATSGGPLRVDLSRPWVKLGVVRPGLYRVTPVDLAGAGIATGTIDPMTFRLFRAAPGDLPESTDVDLGPDSLRECAITVTGEGDGAFDASDAVYFYATGATGFGYDLAAGGGTEYESAFRSDVESLWLTWGPGPVATPPLRIAARDAAPGTIGAPLLATVTHRVHFEEDRFEGGDYFQAPLRWERWFMRSLTQGSRIAFVVSLPGAVSGGLVSLRARMWGRGASAGTALPDHVARMYWNHSLADTAGWNFSLAGDLVAAGPATAGIRDTFEVEVPFLRDPTDSLRGDSQFLAWFEAGYPRSLAAVNDTLQFAAPDSAAAGRVQYAISAVQDSAAAWLLDRTDPERPVRLTGGAWAGAAPSFALTVEDSVGPGYRPRYSLLSTARAIRPTTIARYAPLSSAHAIADLLDPGNAADYLIVAPPAFLAAAESLAADRSRSLSGVPSPRAAIATTERIFAQFGAGLPDPVAIRNLLVYASRHWAAAPLYVCLLGDASEDPKNLSGFGVPDLVPAYENYWDQFLQVQYITDDFYAFLDGPGDALFDLAVGRLPARDPVDALAMVTGKRRTYEGTAEFDFWRARALLSADDAWKWSLPDKRDPAGPDHVRQMERKDRLHIPYPIRRAKVYVNDYAFADSNKTSKPGAREAFVAAVNAGNWLVDYVGHGNESILADEQVFQANDVGRLTNAARASIFAFMSCTVGRFDDFSRDGLAELLLRSPTGGAVVSLAASAEVFGVESTRLNDALMDALFPAAPRADTVAAAGIAWALAKNQPGNVNIIARKYSYLGDPAVVPPLPRGRAVWEKAPLDSLLRGDAATIRGHALNADGSADTVSTGTAQIEVLGPASIRNEPAFELGFPVNVPYALPGPLLYRGVVSLDKGEFEARFVVPTDGRVAGPRAELRALLSAAGGRGVGLAADSIRIGAGLSPRVDQEPPTISLRYAAGSDSVVKPGDRVTLVLADSSGIDLTGLDNAHSIFVIVDDKGTPIGLTPGFAYDPGSHTRGSVDLTIPPLALGAHLLEVHASDTYRNIGVARFYIDVAPTAAPGTALTLTEVFNYPNPFPRETYIHARLNRAARLRIQILTVAGRRVRELSLDGRVGENYVPWDGRDSQGEKVAIGVYLFKITADAPGGSRVTAVGRALRTD
ncbi:MAG TPA: C25 family cysteine peptidase [Candidatus Eisenbacteria bacterium]